MHGDVGTADDAVGSQRTALGNGDLVRHVVTRLLAVAAEWAVFIGVLKYAYDREGTGATGLASIALLLPYVIAAPIAGTLAERLPPNRVRLAGLGVQAVGYGASGAAALADLPTVWVVAPAMLAVGALTTLRPTGAVLLPAIVRSTRELTVGNLWTGYAETAGGLAGPAVATVLLAVGDAPLVIIGCAAMAILAAAVTALPRPIDPPGGSTTTDRVGPIRTMRRNLAELGTRPGVLGVLAVAGAQFVVSGALDIIVVVVAEDRLGLGAAGPGLLLTAIGGGAVAGGLVSTVLVRGRRLAPLLAIAMVVVAALAFTIGLTLSVVAAFVILPLIGLARAVIDLLADVLLHRSAPPEILASVYAVIEVASGVGLILGSLGTQALLAVADPETALMGVGAFFVLLLAVTARSLRSADDAADVPVVPMSLVRQLPVFSALPRAELETLCRSAIEVPTRPGEVLIREGEAGDRFYAVASGTFEVTVAGVAVHRAKRGHGFGEIALLADVPRTATVTSLDDGLVLAIDRAPFLIAVTGHDTTRQAAWGVVRSLGGDAGTTAEPYG